MLSEGAKLTKPAVTAKEKIPVYSEVAYLTAHIPKPNYHLRGATVER